VGTPIKTKAKRKKETMQLEMNNESPWTALHGPLMNSQISIKLKIRDDFGIRWKKQQSPNVD
jgi:hypothetical protein